jgi:hypothetical protein
VLTLLRVRRAARLRRRPKLDGASARFEVRVPGSLHFSRLGHKVARSTALTQAMQSYTRRRSGPFFNLQRRIRGSGVRIFPGAPANFGPYSHFQERLVPNPDQNLRLVWVLVWGISVVSAATVAPVTTQLLPQLYALHPPFYRTHRLRPGATVHCYRALIATHTAMHHAGA